MPILARELHRNKKAFLIWTIVFILYNLLMFSMYPTMAQQGESYQELIEVMPKEFRAAFNIDQLNFADILSFFGTYSYLYFTLAGSIYAMILGAGILSKEENDKTIEFLLSKPVTRNEIVTSKVLCTFIYLFLFTLVFSLVSFLLIETYQESAYSLNALLLLFTGPLLVFYLFAAVGLLISVFITKTKSILPLAMGAVMGTFVIGIVSELTEKAQVLRYLSPFKYVEASDIIAEKQIEPAYLILFILTIFACIVMTYYFYKRKDITI